MSWKYEGIEFKTFKVFWSYKQWRGGIIDAYAKYITVYVFGSHHKPVMLREDVYLDLLSTGKKLFLTPII